MVLPCWMGPAMVVVLALAAPDDDLVVGRLDGAEVRISELLDDVVAEHGSTDLGESAREQLIQERVVEREARRRGLEVTDQQVEQRIAEIDRQIRQQSNGDLALVDHLAEQGIAHDQFRRLLRQAILCEDMIREDFGMSSGAAVPREKQTIWFAEKRLQNRIVTENLPEDVIAQIGGEDVTHQEWALTLFRSLSPDDQRRVFDDHVTILLLKRTAKALELEITSEEISHEVRRRDAEVHAKLKAQGVPADGVGYLDMIRARGGDVQQVLDSDKFRASILARMIADKQYGARDYRDFYDAERSHFDQHFGERWRLSTIYLAAAEQANDSVPRNHDGARKELAGMRERIEEDPEQRDDLFGRMARIYSDHSSRGRGGDMGYLSVAQLEGLGLAAAVVGRPAGELVGPVVVEEGAHLALITAHRPAPDFDELRSEVEREAMRRVTRALLENATIEWLR